MSALINKGKENCSKMDSLKLLLTDSSLNELEPQINMTTSFLAHMRTHTEEEHILYGLAKECLSKGYASSDSKTHQDLMCIADMRELLNLSELKNTLIMQPSELNRSNSHLMDNDYDILLDRLRSKITPRHEKLFNRMLSDHLEKLWTKITNFIFPTEEFCSLSDGMMAVVQKIKGDKKVIEESKAKLRHRQEQRRELVTKVVQEKMKCISQLDDLIEKNRYSDHSLEQLKYLAVIMKAHFLKLKSVEMKVLNMTYTTDAVTGLKIVHEKLDKLFNEAYLEAADLQDRLRKYKDLGPEFEDMVREYAQIKSDLEFMSSVQQGSV